MSFDVNWDIDKYKEEHESEDHWQLRRNFMVKWKSSYPEERLVCLARVFANIEFMGCRYPVEVMQEVARMSKEVNINITYNITSEKTGSGGSDWLRPACVMYDSASLRSDNTVPEGYYDGKPINETDNNTSGYAQTESFPSNTGSESIYEEPQNPSLDICKAGWYRLPKTGTSSTRSNVEKNPTHRKDFDNRKVGTHTSMVKSLWLGNSTSAMHNPTISKDFSTNAVTTYPMGCDNAVFDQTRVDSGESIWAGWDERPNNERSQGTSHHKDVDDRVLLFQNTANVSIGPGYSDQSLHRNEEDRSQGNSHPKDIDDRVLHGKYTTNVRKSKGTLKSLPSTTRPKNTRDPKGFHDRTDRDVTNATSSHSISNNKDVQGPVTKPLYTTEVISIIENPLTILYPNEPIYVTKRIGKDKISTLVLKFTYHATFKNIFIYTVDKHDKICRDKLRIAKKQRLKWWMAQGKTREEALFLCLKSYSRVYCDMMDGKCRPISEEILLEQIKTIKHLSVPQEESDASEDDEIINRVRESEKETTPEISLSIPTADELRAQIMAQAKSVIQATKTNKESEVISLITPDSSPVRTDEGEIPNQTTKTSKAISTTNNEKLNQSTSSTNKSTAANKATFSKNNISSISQLNNNWLRRYKFWISHGKTKTEALLLSQRRFKKIPEYKRIIDREEEIKRLKEQKRQATQGKENGICNKPMNLNSKLNVYIQDCRSIFLRQSKMIWKAVQDCLSPDDKDIKLIGIGRKNGCAIVTCADEHSRDWLDKQVPTLMPWPGAQLKIVDETYISMVLARAFFPNTNLESKEDLLNKLHAQNPYLGCDKWRVLNMQSEGEGQLVLFRFPEKVCPKIRAEYYHLIWNEDTVRIRVQFTKKVNIPGSKQSVMFDQYSSSLVDLKNLEKNVGMNQCQALLLEKDNAANLATSIEAACNSKTSETPYAGPTGARSQISNEQDISLNLIGTHVPQNEGCNLNPLQFYAMMGQVPTMGISQIQIPYQQSGVNMTNALGRNVASRPFGESDFGQKIQGKRGRDHQQNKGNLEEDYTPRQMDIDKGYLDYSSSAMDSAIESLDLRHQNRTYTRWDDPLKIDGQTEQERDVQKQSNLSMQEDIDGIPLDYSSPDRDIQRLTTDFSPQATGYKSREDLHERLVDLPLHEGSNVSRRHETDLQKQATDYFHQEWDIHGREPEYFPREMDLQEQMVQPPINIPLHERDDIPRLPTDYSPEKVAHIVERARTTEYPFQEDRVFSRWESDDPRNETSDGHMATGYRPREEFGREQILGYSSPERHLHGRAEEYPPREKDAHDYCSGENDWEIDREGELYRRSTHSKSLETGVCGNSSVATHNERDIDNRGTGHDPREMDVPDLLNDYNSPGHQMAFNSLERDVRGHSNGRNSQERYIRGRASLSPSKVKSRGQPTGYNSRERDIPRRPSGYSSRKRNIPGRGTDLISRGKNNIRDRAAKYSSRVRKVQDRERNAHQRETGFPSRESDGHGRVPSRERNVHRPATEECKGSERTTSRERDHRRTIALSSCEREVNERATGFSARERDYHGRAPSRERNVYRSATRERKVYGQTTSRERVDERATERLEHNSQDRRVQNRAGSAGKRRHDSSNSQRRKEAMKRRNPAPRTFEETSADSRGRRRRGRGRGRGRGVGRQH